jgi:hypothetical protein
MYILSALLLLLAGDGRSPQDGALTGGAGFAGDGRSPQDVALVSAQFDAIVASSKPDTQEQACAQMIAWVDAHSQDALAPRGLLWVGQVLRSGPQPERSRQYFERLVRDYPQTDWALHARKGIADLEMQRHHFSRAIAIYDELAGQASPFWQYLGSNAARVARGERNRFYLFLTLVVLFALLWIPRLRRLEFWPLPRELIYPLPVLLLILLAATSQEPEEAHGIEAVALCAIALLWLNGSWLRLERRKPWLDAALGVLQLCAMLFCCIVATGLWGKVMDTFAGGGD